MLSDRETGIFFLTLLPMTAAMAIGALIKMVSSRMKYKNLVSIVLTLAAVVFIILFSTPLAVLFKKELKRYFSSIIYVVNMLAGYLLMIAAGLVVLGNQKLEGMITVTSIVFW